MEKWLVKHGTKTSRCINILIKNSCVVLEILQLLMGSLAAWRNRYNQNILLTSVIRITGKGRCLMSFVCMIIFSRVAAVQTNSATALPLMWYCLIITPGRTTCTSIISSLPLIIFLHYQYNFTANYKTCWCDLHLSVNDSFSRCVWCNVAQCVMSPAAVCISSAALNIILSVCAATHTSRVSVFAFQIICECTRLGLSH